MGVGVRTGADFGRRVPRAVVALERGTHVAPAPVKGLPMRQEDGTIRDDQRAEIAAKRLLGKVDHAAVMAAQVLLNAALANEFSSGALVALPSPTRPLGEKGVPSEVAFRIAAVIVHRFFSSILVRGGG